MTSKLDSLQLECPQQYDVSFDKARKHMAPVVIRAVRFRNNFQTMHPLQDKEEGIFIVRQGHGDKLITVRLAGESGDGPTCDCDDPDPRLCLHLCIVLYHPYTQGLYDLEQLHSWGWVGDVAR
eukprot:g53524.t1